jgi:RHS repeat-associated protein
VLLIISGPFYKDVETSLYYLNSRYYNPEIGRFINADGLVGPIGGILTHNMYAYGLNNPVMNTDPSGYFVITTSLLIGAAIFGAVLGGTVAGVGAYNSGHSLGESLLIGAGGALGASMALGGAIAAGGTLFGLSSGGSIAAGLGISIGISATTGGVNSIIGQSVKNNKFTADFNRTSNDMFQSGINGALNFGIGLWMGGAGLYNIPKGSNPGIIDFGVRVTLTNIIGGGWRFANSAIFREINGETEEWRESIWRMRDWIIGY